jgi:plastocyanin
MKKVVLIISVIIISLTAAFSMKVYATKWIINVQDFFFSPSSLPNVVVGDTINWVWINGSHTTTSTSVPVDAVGWDNPINSTSTSFEYKVSIAGTYNYKCTPHASIGMIGSFVASNPSAVQDLDITKFFRIYPNPAKDIFKIAPDASNTQPFEVTVLNLAGQEIDSRFCKEDQECAFDLSAAPEGYYIIKIKSGNTSQAKKLIISR